MSERYVGAGVKPALRVVPRVTEAGAVRKAYTYVMVPCQRVIRRCASCKQSDLHCAC